MTKLEKLLYRKASTEKLMGIWNKGIKIYSDYIFELKALANDKSKTKLERAEAKKNIHESEIPLKHYITSWKLAEREYFNHIIPEIEKTATEEEQNEKMERALGEQQAVHDMEADDPISQDEEDAPPEEEKPVPPKKKAE